MIKLIDVKTRRDLALLLGIPLKELTYILYVKKTENCYTTFEIPKKSGGIRKISAPTEDLKKIQKRLSGILCNHQERLIKENQIWTKISYGFEKDKNIIMNAGKHVNKRYIINMDLENFFESFHFGRVRGYFYKNKNFDLPIQIATILAQLTCFNGSLPQGAPTSPIITNLICNILDLRITKLAKRYKLNYTRYADDLTFSTNDQHFLVNKEKFYKEIEKEIKNFGFSLNQKKTRFIYKDSSQEVTGLTVNKKVNIKKNYYKKTRAMVNSLYINGIFFIEDRIGKPNELEGRFAFIDQVDHHNNKLSSDGEHSFKTLSSREKQYRNFLFYKYFFENTKPMLMTEGKTDILYIKTAIKKYYKEYPNLIKKVDENFEYKVTFLNKSRRLNYFLDISPTGADTMKKVYYYYMGYNNHPNLDKFFKNLTLRSPLNPVILIFDNEQVKGKPLASFKGVAKINHSINIYLKVVSNLYLLTNPLINGLKECEIEDLFDEKVLQTKIEGKVFSREDNYDKNIAYGKDTFSKFIWDNYEEISFKEFIPMLDALDDIIKNYKNPTKLL